MRLPTLMSLALAVALAGAAVPALAAPERGAAPERNAAERPSAERPTGAAPAPAPASTPSPSPASSAASPPATPATARPGERRRRNSYAACNRESHRRNLYGGPRRRFLIRCRLGYELRRPGPAAGPARRP